MHIVSELYKLGMTTEEYLCWLKKELVSLWKGTPADTKSLPQRRALGNEQTDVVRALSHKMSLVSNGKQL